MTEEPIPEWLYPPEGGWTADDMDGLPPGGPRFELLDGSLVMMSPQTDFHSVVMRRLTNAIEDFAPSTLLVRTEMTVRLGKRQRPEPDIVIADAPLRAGRTSYEADEVVLAVEIVSAESEIRDREWKPQRYAQSGIRHFWRVENEKDVPVVHVYELDDTTHVYVATGIHRERLVVAVPFAMDVDLTRLYTR